jgi:hypothetical protein
MVIILMATGRASNIYILYIVVVIIMEYMNICMFSWLLRILIITCRMQDLLCSPLWFGGDYF